MSIGAQRLLDEVLHFRNQSLDSEADDDAERLWQEEVSRRVLDFDAGTVKTIAWSEVRASLTGPNHV